MLQNNTSNNAEVPPAISIAGIPIEEETLEQANAIQALMDSLSGEPPQWHESVLLLNLHTATASSEFLTAPSLTSSPQFLTSPLESPWDDFLQTPAMGTEGDFTPDIYTSPDMFDSNDMMFEGGSLFGDMATYEATLIGGYQPLKPPAATTLPMGDLYTLSPHTPALDSLDTSPALVDESSFAVPTHPARRKAQPTGTRKNVMPESLIPLNAPIQSRKYVTPSATSRKEVPATFARKRSRSSAFGEEEGDVAAAGPVDENEEEAIKSKRLQNTLAARRSRKRKLEHQRNLEDEIARLNMVADAWRQHALDCRIALEAAGIVPPAITPDLASLG